ncbi:hypothetical protein B0T26DRAFT_691104 [Lasiosphaeria miniovina]|uniref:WD repeat-containing protein n=1 Tax=Lasiosphaeria miniovina TaxID=1954250 RepID=A0AA40BJ90_9PEZI|nr:uncharacterized protein B0T26DRAFT_691104 [Lasiosphaeria miniovina]KAK0735191.1 hypothetical protein B0T26DRAFT_691104 [Lasiosphaeria miniovina]
MYNIGNQGKIMRKLLGKSAIESVHDTSMPTSVSGGITSSPLIHEYRPIASQNASYSAGVPIGCIDISPDGHSAVLAGRHVLRTVSIDGLAIRDALDLRALLTEPAFRSAAGAGSSSSSSADQLSIRDVKWGGWQNTSSIFTACAGGKIFKYDLMRAGSSGIEFVQIREDSRQVNALDINPHRGTYVLSGSQDGLVRLIDLHMPIQARTGITFRAVQTYKCNADGVRQVQWSPKDGFLFACGTEKGVVLKWDLRKASAPLLRINAHDTTCSSIAWHADGEHLASAGWDSKCHVWDMSKTADKRQKPKWTISAPAPVSALAWRPGQWSATAQGKRSSQIAISYDEISQKKFGITGVHIWDLARPTMPYREIQRFESSPNALLWRDQNLLWTAGEDCLFNQCDVTSAPKVIDRQAVSTMSFSPRGEVVMFLDERAPSHRPRPQILHPDSLQTPSYSSSPKTPRFSVSRSDSEDDVLGSFLGPRRRGSRRRRPSARPTHVSSTTPPAGSGMDDVLSLEQTIQVTGIYKPQQSMAIGHVPASANVHVYEYLSANYLETLYKELPFSPGGRSMPERVAAILEHYAEAAEQVNKFRLAQTWRILAYGIDLVLRRRAQYHLECRMDHLSDPFSIKRRAENKIKAMGNPFGVSIDTPMDGEETPRKVMSLSSLDKAAPRSLLSEELESTSNVPTPLARPVQDHAGGADFYDDSRGKKLTPIIEPESFTLPPAIQPQSLEARRRLDSAPLSVASQDSETTQASTEGYDFYDAEALSKAIDVPFSRQRPHGLDIRDPGSPIRVRKGVMRHDSDDSFSRLFSTSDGSRRATGLTHSSGSSMPRQATDSSILSEMRHASGSDDEEFESRIRGKQIDESPERLGGTPFRRPLERTETNLTAFTDEHHMITQTTTDSYESRYPSQTDAGFSVGSISRRSPLNVPEHIEPGGDQRLPYIIETDYLPWAQDPPYPHPVRESSSFSISASSPLQPYSLISKALAFEAKSSALNASAIVLLLKPLVPEDVIDSFQAAAILRQHHSRLMNMKLFVEAAVLRKLSIKGWPGGVLSSWGDNYPAISAPLQEGVQVGFFCSTCRKPREVERSFESTATAWRCERCQAVMAPCAICGERDKVPKLPPASLLHVDWAGDSGESDDEETILATWWYCPGCSHGGHSSCLQGWHATFEWEQQAADSLRDLDSSGGYCPLDGCGHACLSGRFRADSTAGRTDEVSSRAVREATRGANRSAALSEAELIIPLEGDRRSDTNQSGGGFSAEYSVRRDGDEVAQSRAVESVRETLWAGGSHQGAGGGGTRVGTGILSSMGIGGNNPSPGARAGASILSSSPGRGGERVERERRKSVKFMPTEEKR